MNSLVFIIIIGELNGIGSHLLPSTDYRLTSLASQYIPDGLWLPNANLGINSFGYRLPSVTECPRHTACMHVMSKLFNKNVGGFVKKIFFLLLFKALDPKPSPRRLEEFKNTETGRTSEVKGFQNEQKVVNALVEYSQLKELGLKIFQGVDVNYKKASALSAALKPIDVYKDKVNQMEIDIVAIGKSAIYLVETKSSIGQVLVSLIKSIEMLSNTNISLMKYISNLLFKFNILLSNSN